MQISISSSKPVASFLRLTVCAVLGLGGAESPAWADDESVFQEHYQRGIQLYKLDALRPAIKEFVAAYAANPLPRLLYNLGQLQRKVGDNRDAIESYELYLRTDTELTPERKKEVTGYIEALRGKAPGAAISAGGPAAQSSAEPQPAGENKASDAPLLLILPPVQSGKAGRTMFNVGIGYAYPVFDALPDGTVGGLVVRPEMGFALNHNRNAYFILSPQFEIIKNSYQVALTVGFQYDFPILTRGLFLHVTGSIGYALDINLPSSTSTTGILLAHRALIIPELGFKYVVNGRVNFGFHPISLPIYLDSGGYGGSYRTTFYAGYNF